jgi:peptidyl-tRNA hydrolase
MMKRGDKLYIVTRRDLSPGYQAVQSIHAAQQFALQFPTLNSEWQERSNFLGLLSVKDEVELRQLARKAEQQSLAVAVFCEPDIDWEITAIAIEAGSKSRRLCKTLPLALK